MDDILGGRVSKLEIVPESEEARPADRVQIAFGRRLNTRARHGGDDAFQSSKRGGRIAGHGKRVHPVEPPFPGPAARAIQKNTPDRPSSGICVRRHRIAPPSDQASACASPGSGTGRDALRPLPFSSRSAPCRHWSEGRRIPVGPETRAGRGGDRPSPASGRKAPAARCGRRDPEHRRRDTSPSAYPGGRRRPVGGGGGRADPGHTRPGIRGPLALVAASPSRRRSAGPWQRLGKAPAHPCAGGPQYRNILLTLMTKPRLRRSHPRSGRSPPVTSR